MHRAVRLFILAIVVLANTTAWAQAASTDKPEQLEEVVVTGRQPGPPLWKVSNGDHVLWILPLIDLYPKKMEWESSRVERLIAQSQEFIQRPAGSQSVAASLNPMMLMRLYGLYKKATYLPDKKKLKDVLAPDMYERFRALKSRYFPRDAKIESMYIGAAGRAVQQDILDHENLQILGSSLYTPALITRKLNKWLDRNKSIRRTDVSVGHTLVLTSDSVKAMKELTEKILASPGALELGVPCFGNVLTYFEAGLEPTKKRANAWARGDANDLVGPTRPYVSESCRNPDSFLEGHPAVEEFRKNNPALASALLANRAEDLQRSKEKWLAAAESALRSNATTFSSLETGDILEKDGLVARLQAQGYAVEVSAE